MEYIDNNTLSSILDIDILNEIRNQINLIQPIGILML